MRKALSFLSTIVCLFPLKAKCQNLETVPGNKITSHVMNLSSSKFRNGDTIFIANSDREWSRAARKGIPAMRYFKGSTDKNANIYAVYNWAAVVDARGLAPGGWHIPSYKEWNDKNSSLRYAVKFDTAIVYDHGRKHELRSGVLVYNRCWAIGTFNGSGLATTVTIFPGGSFILQPAIFPDEENSVLCIKD